MTKRRNDQINGILKELAVARTKASDYDRVYAIDQNIRFFEAARSFRKFLQWVFTEMNGIDSARLLEINDILPKYDKDMHIHLMEIEQRKFPGLVRPLVLEILRFIRIQDAPLVLVNVGSGGMETDRQVINKLIAGNCKHRIVFVAVDQSSSAHKVAKENLSTLREQIQYERVENLTREGLVKIVGCNKGIKVVACKNDIFDLGNTLGKNAVDLVYHSLFLHHLNLAKQEKLMRGLRSISGRVLEYDGIRSNISLIPQIKNAWRNPVFLNAVVFSNLRFREVQDLAALARESEKVSIFRQKGTYIHIP